MTPEIIEILVPTEIQVIEVEVQNAVSVVDIVELGPQGPMGPSGPQGPAGLDGPPVDTSMINIDGGNF